MLLLTVTLLISPSGVLGSVIGNLQLPGLVCAEHAFSVAPKRPLLLSIMAAVNGCVYAIVAYAVQQAFTHRRVGDSVAR